MYWTKIEHIRPDLHDLSFGQLETLTEVHAECLDVEREPFDVGRAQRLRWEFGLSSHPLVPTLAYLVNLEGIACPNQVWMLNRFEVDWDQRARPGQYLRLIAEDSSPRCRRVPPRVEAPQVQGGQRRSSTPNANVLEILVDERFERKRPTVALPWA